jgi:hypothetical protein
MTRPRKPKPADPRSPVTARKLRPGAKGVAPLKGKPRKLREREVLQMVELQPLPLPTSKARFSQSLSPDKFDTLPEFCTWEGNEPALQHLKGLLIPTREVERVVPVGARENIWVVMPDGSRERPWLNCWVTEYDENGDVVVENYAKDRRIATRGPRAMGTAELGALGMTDHDLDQLSREVLGKPWEPDSLALSDLRRERFDEVFRILMAK